MQDEPQMYLDRNVFHTLNMFNNMAKFDFWFKKMDGIY